MDRKLVYLLSLLFAAIGLVDSIYLTATHYLPSSVPLACPDKGVINCGLVTNSQFSIIKIASLQIPVAVLGVAFFLAELAIILIIKNNDAFIILSGIGLAFVLYFLYAEYTLGAICIYCTLVHICTVSLLVLALLGERK